MPDHKHSLARAFAVCRLVVETLRKLEAKKKACLQPKYGTVHVHLKNHKLENYKVPFFQGLAHVITTISL